MHVFYADDLCLMAPNAITLQKLIYICHRNLQYISGCKLYSFEIIQCCIHSDVFQVVTSTFLHINGALIPYTDSIRIFFYRQSQERQYYVKTNENVICIACSNILVDYLVLVVEMYLLNEKEISVEHVTVIIWGYIIKSHRFLKFQLYTSICTVIFCLSLVAPSSQ